MSQCEDLELKDLVTEALENNGVLARLRAQLRANIFLALEDENEIKHVNPKLKDVLNTQNGSIAFMLVQELLEYCNLLQTSSVFKSETGQGKLYVYEGRDMLFSKHLNLSNAFHNDGKSPMLVQVIQMLFELKLINVNEENGNIDEKSFEGSDGGVNMDTQNNTFVVNSGRSDNYDLSFVSDADSSNSSAPNEKKITANSTESSESISTDLNGDKSKSGEYEDLKQDNSISSVVISEALVVDKNSTVSPPTPEMQEVNSSSNLDKESSKTTKTTSNTYSKYLKEKQNGSKLTNDNHNREELNVNENNGPVDIVMRHVIQSRILDRQVSESGEEESLSEELQAFDKSEKNNGITETSISLSISEDNLDTDKSISPVKNILDETLPESPNTKQHVIENINSLKRQTLRITDDDEIIFSDNELKLNLRNLDDKFSKTKPLDIFKSNKEKNKVVTKNFNQRGNNDSSLGELLIDPDANIMSVFKNASNDKSNDSATANLKRS